MASTEVLNIAARPPMPCYSTVQDNCMLTCVSVCPSLSRSLRKSKLWRRSDDEPPERSVTAWLLFSNQCKQRKALTEKDSSTAHHPQSESIQERRDVQGSGWLTQVNMTFLKIAWWKKTRWEYFDVADLAVFMLCFFHSYFKMMCLLCNEQTVLEFRVLVPLHFQRKHWMEQLYEILYHGLLRRPPGDSPENSENIL